MRDLKTAEESFGDLNTNPMKLALDAFWWESGPPSGRYVVREFVQSWLQTFPEDDIVLAVRACDMKKIQEELPNVTLLGLRTRPHGIAVAFELPWRLRGTGRTIFNQNFAALSRHSAVFIHDVLFLSNPEWFKSVERKYLSLIRLLARPSTVVLTSSHSEADRIRKYLTKVRIVHVVGLGISDGLLSSTPSRPRIASGEDFYLSVGRLNVRKNLQRVIEAAAASGEISAQRPLVVVGESNGKEFTLNRLVSELAKAGAVVFSGRVSDGELRWLYERARALIYVSLDEGFGLPPREAAKFGTPMLLSDIRVLRELNGSAPIYVNPNDTDAISLALQQFGERGMTPSDEKIESTESWPDVIVKARRAIATASPR